jgi:hypothetical protein
VGNSLWQMEHLWTLLEAAAPSEDAAVDDVAGSRTSIGGGTTTVMGAGDSRTGAAGAPAEAGGVGSLARWLVLWPPSAW